MRAQVPIVPVAVVGAEEAMPIVRPAQRAAEADRAPVLPDHPDVPALRAARLRSATCRPSSRSASSSRSRPTSGATSPRTTAAWSRRRRRHPRPHPGRAVRHARQAHARSGSDERSSSPALSSFWGGRLAQALERDPEVEVIIGVAPDDRRSSSSAPSTSASAPSTRCCGGSCRRREIDTVVDSRLIVDSRTASRARRARGQRDRDDEHPRRLLRARLAGAQVRLQVLGALLRLRAGRPGVLHRGACSARTRRARALERDIVEAEEAVARVRRAQPGRHRHRAALRQRARPDLSTAPRRAALAAGGAVDPRLRPALPVHPRGRHRRRARARRARATCRESTTPPATGCSCSRRSRPARQAAGPVLPPWGTGPGRRARCGRSASDVPPRDARPAALRPRRSTTASSRPPELRCATRRARRCRRSPSTCACAALAGRRRAPYRYEREVEEFLRYSPACAASESGQMSRRASELAGLVAGTPPVLPVVSASALAGSFFIVATLVVLLVAAAGGRLRVRLTAVSDQIAKGVTVGGRRRRRDEGGRGARQAAARACSSRSTGRSSRATRASASAHARAGAGRRRHRRLDRPGDRSARARANILAAHWRADLRGKRSTSDIELDDHLLPPRRSAASSRASARRSTAPPRDADAQPRAAATSTRRPRPTGLTRARRPRCARELRRALLVGRRLAQRRGARRSVVEPKVTTASSWPRSTRRC